MKTSLRDYWNIIYYNYEQIRFAEIKSSVILSIYSLIFTLGYTIDILDGENVYQFEMSSLADYISILFVIVVLFFTISSFISCVRCFLPRLEKSNLNSPLFFGDVSMGYQTFEVYNEDLNNLLTNDVEYRKHLSHMVYVTSNIAFTKFKHVNAAIKALIKAIISFVFLLAIIYLF